MAAVSQSHSQPSDTANSILRFACVCGSRLRSKVKHVGKQTKCPACGRVLIVPDCVSMSQSPPVTAPFRSPPLVSEGKALNVAASAGVDPIGEATITSQPAKPRYFNLAAIIAGSLFAFSASSVLTGLGVFFGVSDLQLSQILLIYFTGAVFAGFFAASVATHYKVRHSLYTGIAIIINLLPITTIAVLLADHRLKSAQVVSQALPTLYTWMAVALPAAFLGGWLDRWISSWVRKLNPQRQWIYLTTKGVRIRALAPWRHPALAWFWRLLGVGFIGTCWIHFVTAGTNGSGLAFNSILIGLACLILAKKRSGLSVDTLVRRDPRPPVVYLRSFRDDGRKMQEGIWYQWQQSLYALIAKTMEQRLARAARKLGPFIAIGKPGEELPELGAARMYVSDHDWQAVVTDFLTRPGTVVLFQIGETQGLRWELNSVSYLVPPERLLLIVPFTLMGFLVPFSLGRLRRRRAQRYASFRQWGQEVVPGQLPATIGDAFFIYFKAKPAWNTQILNRRHEVSTQHALYPTLELLKRDKTFGWWIFGVYSKIILLFTLPFLLLLALLFLLMYGGALFRGFR